MESFLNGTSATRHAFLAVCILMLLCTGVTCNFRPSDDTAVLRDSVSLSRLIDRYVLSFPPYEEFHGVILVADGDTILFQKAYGMANREFGIPNTPDTRFQVGSITKAFTSMLALKLAEKGIIDLEGTISDYLPWYPEHTGASITVRQLLSHTSGITHHYRAVPDYFRRHDHYFHTPRELIALFQDAPLQHPPGERFTYSSPGFYILGAIMQQVTKRSYAELLQEYIFSPLGMHDTSVENNRTADDRLATGYIRGLSGYCKAYIEDKSTALAAGDLISTVHDLCLWQRALNPAGDDILSAASKATLFAPVLPGSVMTMAGPLYRIPYADGQQTLAVNVLNGSSSGYVSCINRQTEEDRCVIVLSNVNGDDVVRIADDIGDMLMRHYLGIGIGEAAPLTRILPPAVQVPETDLVAVSGMYRTQNSGYTGVVYEAGRLFSLDFDPARGVRRGMELSPLSNEMFHLGHNTSFQCEFSRNEAGGVTGLTALRNGRAFNRATRITGGRIEGAGLAGWFTSLELQRTVRISLRGEELRVEHFPGSGDTDLLPLEKDVFGFSRGFIRFRRDPDGSVCGLDMFTKDTDPYFGSPFIKTVHETGTGSNILR